MSDPFADSQLELACRVGSVEAIDEALAEGADIDANGGAPLFLAIMAQDRTLVEALLARGADVRPFGIPPGDPAATAEALLAMASVPPPTQPATDRPFDPKLVRTFDRLIRDHGFAEPLRKNRTADLPAFAEALEWVGADESLAVVREFADKLDAARATDGDAAIPAFLNTHTDEIEALNQRYRNTGESPTTLVKDYLKASPSNKHTPANPPPMASPKPSPNSAGYRLKITLAWSEPPIWRTFCIPNNITFDRLHDLVQVVMGWEDCHLHHFKVGRRFIGIPDPDGLDDGEIEDECTVTVTKIFNEKGSSVEYEYDFGDGWIHEITSLGPMEKDDRFYQVLDGARACPPEDCGGIGGYDQLIETLANPKHPEHKELKDWAGDDFDPEHFDRDKLNRTISAMIG